MADNNHWEDYLDKLRQLESEVKLTAFWTNETVKATEEVCRQAEIVVKNVREYLEKSKAGGN